MIISAILGRKTIKSILCFLLLFVYFNGHTQDTIKTKKKYQVENNNGLWVNQFDNYRVQWVSQFPSPKGKKRNQNWFSKFIFGKRNIPKIVKPVDIIATSPNEFYVLDQGSGTIFSIKNSNKNIPKLLIKSKLNFPSLVSFCVLPNKEILFTDSRLNKIYAFNKEQKKLVIFNSSLRLKQPTGIAYSRAYKEIWVVETAKHQISILNEQGIRVKTIGKRGSGPGEFNFPTDICIDDLGRAYVIDAMNFRIQVFNKDGEVISIFGEHGDASGYFARPKGIATDTYGNIYITDVLFHTVQVFDMSGNFLYNFGEHGRDKKQFWMPFGIYIDTQNNIYISDSYNSRIQIFKLIREE